MNNNTVDKSLSELNKILDDMLEKSFSGAVDSLTKKEKIDFAQKLSDTQKTILILERQKLEDIIHEFEHKAPDLKEAINKVEKTRQTMEEVEAYLKAVTAFLYLIARILKVAGVAVGV